jgi:hypothetical protein
MKYGLLFVIVFVACVVLPSAGYLSHSETQLTGAAGGVSYSIRSGAFRNYSWMPLPGGFRFVSSSWIGTSSIELSLVNGALSMNGEPLGTLKNGDRLEVASDQHVLVNGTPRR